MTPRADPIGQAFFCAQETLRRDEVPIETKTTRRLDAERFFPVRQEVRAADLAFDQHRTSGFSPLAVAALSSSNTIASGVPTAANRLGKPHGQRPHAQASGGFSRGHTATHRSITRAAARLSLMALQSERNADQVALAFAFAAAHRSLSAREGAVRQSRTRNLWFHRSGSTIHLLRGIVRRRWAEHV